MIAQAIKNFGGREMENQVKEALIKALGVELDKRVESVLSVRKKFGSLPSPSEGDELRNLKEKIRDELVREALSSKDRGQSGKLEETLLCLFATSLSKIDSGEEQLGVVDKAVADKCGFSQAWARQIRVSFLHKGKKRVSQEGIVKKPAAIAKRKKEAKPEKRVFELPAAVRDLDFTIKTPDGAQISFRISFK